MNVRVPLEPLPCLDLLTGVGQLGPADDLPLVDLLDVDTELALPLAGLMSLEPFEAVCDALHALRDAAKDMGCILPEPFLQVAFLALPVIPHLKITDHGLIDVDRFCLDASETGN